MRINRYQLPDGTPIWPMAVHWFANGWMLPEAMDAELWDPESACIPGSHSRLIVAADVLVSQGANGDQCIDIPHLGTTFVIDSEEDMAGTAPYRFVVAIKTEDDVDLCFLESKVSMDGVIFKALTIITEVFLREMGGPDEASEYIEFAAEHFPGLLNTDAALRAFRITAAEASA